MAEQADTQIVEVVVDLFRPFKKSGGDITAETDIMAELEIDSVSVLDVVMELEDRFDISIPLDLMPKLRTVGDLAGAINVIRAETR